MIAGLILAGGKSRRMGGRDKAFIELAGKPLIDHAVANLSPQVARLAISANGPAEHFERFGLPVLADGVGRGHGPLAGVLAGFNWAETGPDLATHLLTVSVDTPFIPGDLASRLEAAAGRTDDLVYAASAGRDHPVIALWPVVLIGALAAELGSTVSEGVAVGSWIARHGGRRVEFPVPSSGDPFFNVNSPVDLTLARKRVEAALR